MAICDTPACDEHYACKIRNKGLQVSPRAQMSRTQNWKPTPSIPDKSRGDIMYDERPGGIKMPLLKQDGTPLRRYEYDEKATTSTLRRIRSSTRP